MGLLAAIGYRNLRYYAGGMADWLEHGGAVAPLPPAAAAAQAASSPGLLWLEVVANFSLATLVGVWLGMIAVFGLLYWLAGIAMGWGLQAGNAAVNPDLPGLGTAIYFSFVTALSIGYGDVVPTGALRFIAIVEGAAGLLIFGCVISKLVSRRQEELTEQIHRTTFEERLNRVRTNLHLVFSDLGLVQQLQAEQGGLPDLVLRRLESTARVLRGELQAVHDLLYRCREMPNEETMESLLSNVIICLEALAEVTGALPGARSATLERMLHSIGQLANEICGECVPRQYAPELKESMDRIQELARRIG